MQFTKNRIKLFALVAPVALALHGCSSSSDFDFEASAENQRLEAIEAAAPTALFDPSNQVIPFPNSVLFSGTEDGTLNVPVADPANLGDPTVALNQMDGFSTTSPIVTGISRAIDPATIMLGSNVRVFEVATVPPGIVTSVVEELGPTQVAVTATDSALVILPLQPLKAATEYMVVITNGIQDAEGVALAPTTQFRLLKGETALLDSETGMVDPQADGLRQLTGAMLAAATAADAELVADDVVVSWTFKTQSIRNVLQNLYDQRAATSLSVSFANLNTAQAVPGLFGLADLYVGTMDVPYYQTAVGEDNNPLAALNGFWQTAEGAPATTATSVPAATSTQNIPVLMTVPNGNSPSMGQVPEGGWPIAIFQHGITRNRTDMLAVADSMANAGFAVISIDMPMHGLVDATSPLSASESLFPNDRERTFDIDVLNSDPTADPGPDGTIDRSGSHFYNLMNLANSRDNFRQAVADLFVLSENLGSLQGVPVNASRKAFIGHSLGGIVGTTFLSYDNSVSTATLGMPGGGISRLLANSGSFGPVINGGLAANDVATGSPEYEQFLTVAQTVIDSGDPINHAADLATSGTAIHMIEVIDDQTVPNAVATAPLSGTEPLARQLGLMPITGTAAGSGLVRFTAGNHGSIIDPTAPEDASDEQRALNLAVTTEMQSQMATFAGSVGTILSINDVSVIQAAP